MTKPKYDHATIDAKWQTYWDEHETHRAQADESKPKYYVLSMLPYPSGAGLHVGHVTGYTAADIIARHMRQKGYNVLHPMGWDSFGLPAEQYAIRTGTHPEKTTKENINTYRRQLKSLGFSYDWQREFATSDPSFYKWTQWLFTKLYERGLAYEAEILVNYCPALRAVLANEEVEGGKSVEGGHPVERRPLRQWILKITEYAERLLKDLDELDWPDHVKRMQKTWIGKSEGAQISFQEKATGEFITVYTTRADTLFGASFLVLSPEHPLVETITTAAQKEDVNLYKQQIASKSDLERTELSKNKTGVFTGAYAQNPATGEAIPIWIADYVLMNYGTGAVMAVPSHDFRDFEFAKKFDLPMKPVYDLQKPPKDMPDDLTFEDVRVEVLAGKRCEPGDGLLINSGDFNGLDMEQAKKQITAWLEKTGSGKKTTNYKLRDWIFSRQRYWGEPIPILHFEDGTSRALELDELPLMPPELSDYKPADDGNSPLAKVKEWVEITDPKTGKKALRETNTMPQWAGSCWYYIRYIDPANDDNAWSDKAQKYWLPVDMYIGGVEHAVLHLLYARFWHKVFYDLKLVSTKEPFKALRNQGLVTSIAYKLPGGGYVDPHEVEKKEGEYFHIPTGKQVLPSVEKMSKSKLNGVTPDEIIQSHGADTLRLYEMFMGPFDQEKLWNSEAVSGCQRFLNRFWDLITSEKITEEDDPEGLKFAHRLVAGALHDIDHMLYNTAISKMMEFVNQFMPLKKYAKSALKMAIQVLYPFAPHLSEEAWDRLGFKEVLARAPLPIPDPKYLTDDQATYIVQVNGKVRGRFELSKGKTKEELLEFVKNQELAKRYLTGDIVKVIYVPDKLLNIVVK